MHMHSCSENYVFYTQSNTAAIYTGEAEPLTLPFTLSTGADVYSLVTFGHE
jgi:hypothetical protein